MTRTRLIAAVAAAALLLPAAAIAHHGPTSYRRLYLLAENDGRLFWSLDSQEPSAEARTVRRRCPDLPRLPGDQPCRGAVTPTGHPLTMWFHPRSQLGETVTTSSGQPIRFRFGLQVETAVPYTVQAGWAFASGASFHNATETSSGVWEGTIPPSAMGPDMLPEIGVRVNLSPSGMANVTIRTDGSSYVELPAPFTGWSFEQLERRSPPPEEPTEFSSPLRSFRFNDDEWEVTSFTGDLSQSKAVTVDLDRRAAWVMGWVETYAEPWVHHLVRNGEAPRERLTDTPRLRLSRDGTVIASGVNLEDEQTGRGTDQLAVLGVDPGPLTLEVYPSDFAQDAAYRAYLLVAYGERTLASMRASLAPNHFYFIPSAQAGGVAVCPGNAERIPLTSEVRAVRLDIDWDSVNPTADWTIRWSPPGRGDLPCGWAGSGDDLKLVDRNALLGWGPTPAYDDNHVAYRDTVVDAEVRLFYEPPPHPDEEG